MKRVSFEVAKALKEAGYPQFNSDEIYVLADFTQGKVVIPKGAVKTNYGEDNNRLHPTMEWAAIPSYIEVWLWLWREKKIAIGCPYIDTYDYWFAKMNAENDKSLKFWEYFSEECNDPEEAIINAIKYLVDNNLIK